MVLLLLPSSCLIRICPLYHPCPQVESAAVFIHNMTAMYHSVGTPCTYGLPWSESSWPFWWQWSRFTKVKLAHSWSSIYLPDNARMSFFLPAFAVYPRSPLLVSVYIFQLLFYLDTHHKVPTPLRTQLLNYLALFAMPPRTPSKALSSSSIKYVPTCIFRSRALTISCLQDQGISLHRRYVTEVCAPSITIIFLTFILYSPIDLETIVARHLTEKQSM